MGVLFSFVEAGSHSSPGTPPVVRVILQQLPKCWELGANPIWQDGRSWKVFFGWSFYHKPVILRAHLTLSPNNLLGFALFKLVLWILFFPLKLVMESRPLDSIRCSTIEPYLELWVKLIS